MAMLAVASLIAMIRIGISQKPLDPALDSSPLGYTFSLASFHRALRRLWIWIIRSQLPSRAKTGLPHFPGSSHTTRLYPRFIIWPGFSELS